MHVALESATRHLWWCKDYRQSVIQIDGAFACGFANASLEVTPIKIYKTEITVLIQIYETDVALNAQSNNSNL